MSTLMTENRDRNITSIVREYGNRLYGFIRNRVSNSSDAEDILQEVWYQISNVAEIESIDQISGWLFRVARNRITDNYRKKKESSIEDLGYSDDDQDSQLMDILLAEHPDHEETELRELFWEALFSALDELPENQKNVFVWNELEDQTFQEISDRTGVNIKTLISRKRYAVQHLRKSLGGLYEEFIGA